MADSEVVTELTVDASGAQDGASQFEAAMADAEAALDKMVAALTGSAAAFAAANDNLVASGNAAAGAADSYQQSADAADAATASHRGFASALGELSSIATLAGTGIKLFATSGVAQMAALGGAFTLVSSNFQNSFAQSIATGTAGVLTSLAAPLRAFAAIGVAVEAMNEITALGVQRVNDLVALSSQIDKAGVSSDFFQRETKAASDFSLATDSAAAALTKFNTLERPDVGGSSMDQSISKLKDAGNFSNNPGVAQYGQATDVEQQWSAVVNLITTAAAQGERLAGLSLASKFLPPDMLQKLTAMPDFLQQLQTAAAAVKPVDIISDDQISQAVQINQQLTLAEATLSDKFKPIMDDIASVGMSWEASWVRLLVLIAEASEAIAAVYEGVKEIGSTPIGSGALYALANLVPVLGTVINAVHGGSQLLDAVSPPQQSDLSGATAKLATGLSNPSNVLRAQLQSTNVEMGVFSDTSKAAADTADAARDAWDRGVTTLERQTLALQADVLTTGQSAAATKELTSEFQLLEAAKTADRGVTDAQISQYTTLRASMSASQALTAAGITLNSQDAATFDKVTTAIGQAATAAATAKITTNASYQGSLLGLNDNDVQIAETLRTIYPNVAMAMASAEAAQLRLNKALSDARGYAVDFTTSFAEGIQQGLPALVALGKAAETTASQMANSFTKLGTQDIFGGIKTGSSDQVGSGVGQVGLGVGISALVGLFNNYQQQQQQLQQAQAAWQQMQTQFVEFTATLTGNGGGSLTSSLQQATAQAQKFADAAATAGESTGALDADLAQYATQQIGDFVANFNVMITALSNGLGTDSPAVKAAQNVEQVGTALQQFIGDTETAVSMTGAQTDAVAAATSASQAYALSLLQAAPTFDTVQTAVLNLDGTAAQLQQTLQDLGMTADQATTAIQSGTTAALAQIALTFNQGIQSQIYSGSAPGTDDTEDYVNQIQALMTSSAGNLADAQLLGEDPAQVAIAFQDQAQAIVNSAGLVGVSFQNLINIFPQLDGVVTASTSTLSQLQTTISNFLLSLNTGSLSPLSPTSQFGTSLASFQQELAEATGGPNVTQDEQTNALSQITSAASALLNSAQAMYQSPQEQLNTLQQAFTTQLADATGANGVSSDAQQSALDNITSTASELLNAAQTYYASSSGYAAIYNQVTTALAGLPAQLTPIEQVAQNTQTTNQILGVLQTLNTSTQNSDASIAASVTALGALTEDVALGQSDAYFAPMTTYLAQISAHTAVLGNSSATVTSPTGDEILAGAGLGAATGAAIGSVVPVIGTLIGGVAGAIIGGIGGFISSLFNEGGQIPIVGHYAPGGLVGNGLFNVDSVRAKYAGGGDIMLSGGEYVTKAPSVNPSTFATLDHINRTGTAPSAKSGGNDLQILQELRQINRSIAALAQVNTATAGQQTGVLQGEVRNLGRTIRTTSKRPRKPGTAKR